MATIETETKIAACDMRNAAIDPEDQRLSKSDLEAPISCFMDRENTIEARLMELKIPHGERADFPDLCRNCAAEASERALERVKRRIESPVKAEQGG